MYTITCVRIWTWVNYYTHWQRHHSTFIMWGEGASDAKSETRSWFVPKERGLERVRPHECIILHGKSVHLSKSNSRTFIDHTKDIQVKAREPRRRGGRGSWGLPPQPTKGSRGASWAPPVGSGAEPRPTTHFRHISGPQKPSARSNALRFRKSNSSTFKDLQTQIQGPARAVWNTHPSIFYWGDHPLAPRINASAQLHTHTQSHKCSVHSTPT